MCVYTPVGTYFSFPPPGDDCVLLSPCEEGYSAETKIKPMTQRWIYLLSRLIHTQYS